MHHHSLITWLLPFEHFSHGHYVVAILNSVMWIALLLFVGKYLYRVWNRRRTLGVAKPVGGGVVGLFALTFTGTALAMCPVAITPPGASITPDDQTQGLVAYEDGVQTLVLQPSFSGDAQEFGMVLPTAAEPELQEAPQNIFTQLNQETRITTPQFRGLESDTLSGGEGVRVIEQKDVGEFSATTLRADSSQNLREWLDENGYALTDRQAENMEYYVKKGGYYFVALKVNMANADIAADGTINGNLDPIEVSYAQSTPAIPLRSMAGTGTGETFDITLYTLANKPYYVPGSEIPYSRRVTLSQAEDELSALSRYNPAGKWLVRNEVTIDPDRIQKDLVLACDVENMVIDADTSSEVKRVNTRLLDETTGVVPGTQGESVTLSLQTEKEKLSKKERSSRTTSASSELINKLWIVAVLLGVLILIATARLVTRLRK